MSDFSQNSILHRSIKNYDSLLLQRWETSGPYSDVNVGNRWNQTPLHYAAKTNNDSLLYRCIRLYPDADVTKQDINGYNVLHCLVFNLVTNFDWKACIKNLTNQGIDINQQTKQGNSVLHLACRIRTSPGVLQYLLESYPLMEVGLTNKNKETFLHLFIKVLNKCPKVSADFKERVELLEMLCNGKFPICPRSVVANLFSQQDVNGQTPLILILSKFPRYNRVDICEILGPLVSDNVTFANIPDNLNNFPLHYTVACMETYAKELIELLIRSKADVNAKNIFGQTMAYLIRKRTNAVDDIILTMQNLSDLGFIDNDTRDKWQCSPLMNFGAALGSEDDLFQLFVKSKESLKAVKNINAGDMHGSTALHYAAYHNAVDVIRFLIQHGANTQQKDALDDTPIQTARRNFATDAEEELLQYSKTNSVLCSLCCCCCFPCCPKENLNDQETRSYIEEIKALSTSGVISGNIDDLLKKMLNYGFYDKSNYQECNQINESISYFIGLLCEQIKKYDSRFSMTPFQSGSTAENTKVDVPNEFDFVLCLEEFSGIFDIVLKEDGQNTVLRIRNPPVKEFLEFIDDNGDFVTPSVFMYFHQYLKRALYESKIWKDKKLENLSYIFEAEFLKSDMVTTVFMVHLSWMGCRYKQLHIKIDLVPAIRKESWWPNDPDGIPLMSKDIKESACLLMLDPVDDMQSFTSTYLKEVVTDNIDRMMSIDAGCTNLRISTAPAEVCLMKSFPQMVRESYALSKYINEIVQPDIITSYMLKNCIFYVIAEMGWSVNRPKLSITHKQLLIKIFELLFSFNQRGNLPRFFMPEVNVFPIDDDEGNTRELKIKLCLAILREDLKHNPERAKMELMKYAAGGSLSTSSDRELPFDELMDGRSLRPSADRELSSEESENGSSSEEDE